MGWWPCGACDGGADGGADCDIASDDFSSGDALTVDWEGDTGSFTKSGGDVTTTSSDKVLIHKTAHPDSETVQIVSVDVSADTASDRVRCIIDYVDSDNYHFAELLVNGASSQLRLFKRSAGTNTQVGSTATVSVAIGSVETLTVCASSGTIRVTLNNTSILQSSTLHGGFKAGIGTGTISGTATFDNFDYGKGDSVANDDCPNCLECDVASDTFSSGDALTVDWEGDTGSFTKALSIVSTTSSDKILIHKATGSSEQTVQVDVISAAVGNSYRIIGDYVDADNYHYAELTIGFFTTPTTTKLFKRSGGVDTQIGTTTEISVGTNVTLTLCTSDVRSLIQLRIQTGSVFNFNTITTTMHGGSQAGLGTGGLSGTATFDNFNFDIRQNADSPGCLECFDLELILRCSNGVAPVAFKVVLGGMANDACSGSPDCEDMDGTYFAWWTARSLNDGEWRQSFFGTYCGKAYTLRVRFFAAGGGTMRLQATVSDGTKSYVWKKDYTGAQDCTAFTDVSLTYQGDPSSPKDCTGVSSTCVLTALFA